MKIKNKTIKDIPAVAQVGAAVAVVDGTGKEAAKPELTPKQKAAEKVRKEAEAALTEARKAAYETGFDRGEAEGVKSGKVTGFASGKRQGLLDGTAQGRKDGYAIGYAEGALAMSHNYVDAIERQMMQHDKYTDLTKWRNEGKIPAWWICALLSLQKVLDDAILVKAAARKNLGEAGEIVEDEGGA